MIVDKNYRRLSWMAFGVIVLSLSSCDISNDSFFGKATPIGASVNVKSEVTSTSKGSSDPIVLKYDFGQVRPGENVEHVFQIKNTSDVPWIIREVVQTCSCTLTEISDELISPGENLQCKIKLSVGTKSQNIRQRVLVIFENTEVSTIQLELQAAVRAHLIVKPPKLVIPARATDEEVTFGLVAAQFGDVNSLSVSSDAEWLSCDIIQVPGSEQNADQGLLSAELGVPTGKWRISVRLDMDQILPGQSGASIVVKSNSSPESHEVIVPVVVTRLSPVQAIPSEVFLGEVGSSVTTQSNITLRFAPDIERPDPQDLVISHNLGSALSIKCTEGPSSELQLIVAFKHENASPLGIVEGAIEVSSPQHNIPTLTIPFLARTSEFR